MWLIALVACFPAWDLGDLGDDADFDGDGVPNSTDCDPNDPTFPQLRFPDLDEDGYPGSPGEERCDTAWGVPEGASDCDDDDPAIGAYQWPDEDNDNLAPFGGTDTDADAVASCTPQDNLSFFRGDCDDTNADITDMRYPDADGDGYGVSEGAEYSCGVEDGWALRTNDCDDDAPAINPGASDPCWQPLDLDCNIYTEECAYFGEVEFAVDPDNTYDMLATDTEAVEVIPLGNIDDPSQASTVSPDFGLVYDDHLSIVHRAWSDDTEPELVFRRDDLLPPPGYTIQRAVSLGRLDGATPNIGLVLFNEGGSPERMIAITSNQLPWNGGTLGDTVPYVWFEVPAELGDPVLAPIGQINGQEANYEDFAIGFHDGGVSASGATPVGAHVGQTWVVLGADAFGGENRQGATELRFRDEDGSDADDPIRVILEPEIEGDDSFFGFGQSISAVGDFNGDGFDDFVVTTDAEMMLPGDQDVCAGGYAFLFLGSETSWDADPTQIYHSSQAHDYTAFAGNYTINPEYCDPITAGRLGHLVGDEAEELGLAVNGVWYLYSSDSVDAIAVQGMSTGQVASFGGPGHRMGFAWTAMNADYDQVPDLIISDPGLDLWGAVWGMAGEKFVYAAENRESTDPIDPYEDSEDYEFSPDNVFETDPFVRIFGTSDTRYVGTQVVNLGDVNGDGGDDLAVGSRNLENQGQTTDYRFYFMGYAP